MFLFFCVKNMVKKLGKQGNMRRPLKKQGNKKHGNLKLVFYTMADNAQTIHITIVVRDRWSGTLRHTSLTQQDLDTVPDA